MLIRREYEGKIVAVWDSKMRPPEDILDRLDASPDGLSGKREGFYFANELCKFTLPFHFEGVEIRPDDYPECLNEVDILPCDRCKFYRKENCPILRDIDRLEMTRAGFEGYKAILFIPRGVYFAPGNEMYNLLLFVLAWDELSGHGRPLHYRILNQIIMAKNPYLNEHGRKIYKLMQHNPIYFRSLGDGVFQAIDENRPEGHVAALDFGKAMVEWHTWTGRKI